MKKNERLILTLFGEGEGGEASVCAAEHTETSTAANEAENTATSNDGGERVSKADRIGEICELLGISNEGEDGIIKALRSRRAKAALMEKLRLRNAKREYSSLMSEASDLLSGEDGFELSRELSNKKFCALIRCGFSLREAWRAVHAEELMEKARSEAQSRALTQALEEIRRQSQRPSENGAGGNAPASANSGVENLSGRGIRDILRRVEKGAKIKF